MWSISHIATRAICAGNSSISIHRVIQSAEACHRLQVHRGFGSGPFGFVAREKTEKLGACREVGQQQGVFMTVVKIMDVKAGEVGSDEPARPLVGLEPLDVIQALAACFVEVLATAFVLDEQLAFPDQVDEADVAIEHADGRFETGDLPPVRTVADEEMIPKTLGIGVFIGGVAPMFGKGGAAGADFVPGEHEVSARADWQIAYRKDCSRASPNACPIRSSNPAPILQIVDECH
jgi:hypothetical protein